MSSDGPPSAFHPVVSRRLHDVSSPDRGESRPNTEEGPPAGANSSSLPGHHVMPLAHSGIPPGMTVSPLGMTNPLLPGMFDRRLLRVTGE